LDLGVAVVGDGVGVVRDGTTSKPDKTSMSMVGDRVAVGGRFAAVGDGTTNSTSKSDFGI
jgi:hypothetical protein